MSYRELVRKEKHNVQTETALALTHEAASVAHRCLVEAAHLLRKLDRQGAQKLMQVTTPHGRLVLDVSVFVIGYSM